MENLIVKNVGFDGDELLAAKDNDGVVWVAVNSLCRGMGLNRNERDRQVKNVQSDEVLKRGYVKFDAGIFDPNNETIALQLDYVPLWLAKISITPNMKKEKPEVAEKLITYQLKAKDALAAAFLPTESKHSQKPAGTPIRLYKNNKWYILTIGDEVYNLAPDEAKTINTAVWAMRKNGVEQVVEVVKTMIGGFKRDCRLKCVRECVVESDKAALRDKSRRKDGGGNE